MLRIFSNSLFVYYLHTRAFTWIFIMWDYVLVLKCACDMEFRGVSNLSVKSKPSIITYVRGYVAQLDWSANPFNNDLISAIYKRSYNG